MKTSTLAIILSCFLAGCGSQQAPSSNPSAANNAASRPSGPVVFMGDSITQFWQTGIPPAYPAANPTISELVPGAVDAGVAGQTTGQMLARFQADVIARHPSVLVLLGGTNDLRLDPYATTSNIVSMVGQAQAAGIRVIIGTIPPSALWTASTFLAESQTPSAIRAWNASLKMIAADYGCPLVDYYSVMVNPNGTENTALFDPDDIHPNSAGYAAMWAVLRPVLAALDVVTQ